MAFPAALSSSPLLMALIALLALIVLATVLAIASRRHWRSWWRTRPEPPRTDSLRERDEHLKLALWASGEHFWDYDLISRRMHHMRANESAPHSAEITVLTGQGEVPAIHEQDMPLVMEHLRSHLQGEVPLFMSEHRMDLAGNGSWTWVRARGRVVERDAEGRPLRIAGTARDITANRNAEYEHRIASEVMRSMSEAVAVLDWDYNFIAVNQSFTRISGYSDLEVIGQPVTLLDSSQHDEAFFEHMRADLNRDHRWSGEVWKVRKDGEEILCKIETNVVPDASGQRRLYVMVLNDITEQKRAEQELRYLANYDTLTSLPNRSLLSERLARAIVRARRENGHVAVLFLDLDRFKDVNDSLGHATGDRVLRAAAERVQHAVGPQHTVARLGGDEFTVVLEGLAAPEEAEEVARRVIESFALPLALDEHHEITVSPSIGISLFPDHAQVPTELLKHADTAMYQAKAAGRRTWQVYSARMDEATRRRATLAGLLRRVVERDELTLVYQPRYSLHEQRVVGTEALVRWHHPEFGLVPPDQFIPLAEDTGLILEIGEWVLREACTTLRQWHEAGLEGMRMSVNVSAIQLLRGDLAATLARILAETGVASGQLELELTESAIMANVGRSASVLHACRILGVGVAVDDFGTGYSSLAYLKRLPLTTLKIDQEFVGDLTRDPDDEAITSTVIAMGHSLALTVVAEGVETAGQLKFLRDHGCDEVQGHYVAAAMDRDECLAFLSRPVPVPA